MIASLRIQRITLLFSALMAGFACHSTSKDPREPEGTGGSPSAGSSSGGAAGDGGVCATGGAIAIPACKEWKAPWTGEKSKLDVECPSAGGNGGEGGSPSYEPALARICENDTLTWKTPPPVLLCLNPLLDKICDADHEKAVRDCLLAPTIGTCNGRQVPEPPAACQELVDKCPGLTLDACSSALISNETRGDCITRDYSPSTCADEFLHCAWDF